MEEYDVGRFQSLPYAEAFPSQSGDIAGRGARLLGSFLDSIAMFVVCFVLALFTAPFVRGDDKDVGAALGILVYFAINSYLLATNGQTIGKRMVGTKIVRTDGSAAGFARILFLRFLPLAVVGCIPVLGSLIGLVDALFIFRESHKCLHDEIADTIVVYA